MALRPRDGGHRRLPRGGHDRPRRMIRARAILGIAAAAALASAAPAQEGIVGIGAQPPELQKLAFDLAIRRPAEGAADTAPEAPLRFERATPPARSDSALPRTRSRAPTRSQTKIRGQAKTRRRPNPPRPSKPNGSSRSRPTRTSSPKNATMSPKSSRPTTAGSTSRLVTITRRSTRAPSGRDTTSPEAMSSTTRSPQ